jgi:hypothetical protein
MTIGYICSACGVQHPVPGEVCPDGTLTQVDDSEESMYSSGKCDQCGVEFETLDELEQHRDECTGPEPIGLPDVLYHSCDEGGPLANCNVNGIVTARGEDWTYCALVQDVADQDGNTYDEFSQRDWNDQETAEMADAREIFARQVAHRYTLYPVLLAAIQEVTFHDDHEPCRFCDCDEGAEHDAGAACGVILIALDRAQRLGRNVDVRA